MPLVLQHLLDDTRFAERLSQEYLPEFLKRQRWYTSKNKSIDQIALTALPGPSTSLGLWLLRINFSDDSNELRPLAVAEVNRAFAPDDQRLICRTDEGALIEAAAEEDFRKMLYEIMAGDKRFEGPLGTLEGVAGKVCRDYPAYAGSTFPPQNSSNTVIAYAPAGFFKLFRKTEAGVHPDAELLGYLSDQCHFESVPAFGGTIRYLDNDNKTPITLGLMLAHIDHRGEAWEAMLHDVSAYAKTVHNDKELEALSISSDLAKPLRRADLPENLTTAVGDSTLRRLELLGQRTAEMHIYFASASEEGMAPKPLDASYWKGAREALNQRVSQEISYAAEALKPSLEKIMSWLEAAELPLLDQGCIRVHGDYHLGQVLDTSEDIIIIDFEGEPLHSLEYRRSRHPAFKDIAGMVRSLHYAPYAYALQEADGAKWAMAAARTWYHLAARLFLTAYFDRAKRAAYLPKADGERNALLAFFLTDKVLYELAYERASRPAWIAIPRQGVEGVADMLGE